MATVEKSTMIGGSPLKSVEDRERSRHDLNSQMSEMESSAMKVLSDAKDKATKATKHALQAVDESAQKHPWSYVGAAALAGGILGYLLSSRIVHPAARK